MSDIITPGSSLVTAAKVLGTSKRRAGTYPYQWLFPGPNSRHVRASGSILMPVEFNSPTVILTYKVPQGMRFVLRGVVMISAAPDWVPGTGDLLFSLLVNSAGSRSVDFLSRVNTPLGDLSQPWPILGRLEFESNNTLTVTVTAVQNVSLGADGGYQTAMLVGHLYPTNEAGEG